MWTLIDNRTGKRCTIVAYETKEQAEQDIAYFQRRDARGGRPDIHYLLPYLEPIELTEKTLGSSPGDVLI